MLLVVTVVALYFPTRAIYEPWRQDRLRVSHHIYHDYTVHSKISDGDSLTDVRRYYKLTAVTGAARARLINMYATVRLRRPDLPRVVVRENDEFYEYSIHGVGNNGYLQFRNARLVNHPHELYADPVANTLRNGSKLPGVVDRMGVWPVYAAVSVLALFLWLTFERGFTKSRK